MPLKLRDEVESALKELESADVTEKVEFSEYASLIVTVRKQSGSIRVCGDFHKINKVLHEYRFPLPNINELISSVSAYKHYARLDLKNAYLLVEIVPDDCKYFVINTHLGLHKYLRLPFGTHPAPAIFQMFISQLLASHDGLYPYYNDIFICGISISKHDQRVNEVLNTLQSANGQLNFKKSVFSVTFVKHPGYMISSKGYAPCEEKVKAIVDAPVHNTLTHLRSF